jgi:hypothetical protein
MLAKNYPTNDQCVPEMVALESLKQVESWTCDDLAVIKTCDWPGIFHDPMGSMMANDMIRYQASVEMLRFRQELAMSNGTHIEKKKYPGLFGYLPRVI